MMTSASPSELFLSSCSSRSEETFAFHALSLFADGALSLLADAMVIVESGESGTRAAAMIAAIARGVRQTVLIQFSPICGMCALLGNRHSSGKQTGILEVTGVERPGLGFEPFKVNGCASQSDGLSEHSDAVASTGYPRCSFGWGRE